ncbi:MAG: ThuA domain-containing protein [Verrucomicrobia bacterium]|nr:ThuA domain-containing protein [Verrucomicrobiota bacterium]
MLYSVMAGQAVEKEAPLRALLVTGGCCHDYETQKGILTNGISARANVTWTVVHEATNNEKDHEFSIYKNADWTKGFDVIVHNECSGKLTNVTVIERIVSAHTRGVPAVMIHCTMHSYRDAETDEWRKLVGVTSMRHQRHEPFEVENLQPEHPVMKDFPVTWKTPNGELYEIEKLWPNCKPLAQAYGTRTKKDHACIWVNTYGKARVFGTTLGHFNEEMDNEVFLGLVTRGLLWSCNKLDDNGKPKAGYGK